MRAERLFSVCDALHTDYNKTDLVAKLKALQTTVQNQVNNPSGAYSSQIAAARVAVFDAIESSQFAKLAASDARDLEAIRMGAWVGSELRTQIEQAFSGNDLVPSEALEKLTLITTTVEKDYSAAVKVMESLNYFGIPKDQLKAGEFEISVLIPRKAIDNEVNELGSELIKINRYLTLFSEIVTGSRDNYKINAISTTDPTIYLYSLPGVAAAVSVALDKVMGLYEKVLTIRKMRNELKNQGVPPSILSELKSHIETTIKEGLEDHAKEIDKQKLASVEAGRRAELNQEVRSVLWELAQRLDEGYEFDIRGEPPAKDKNGEEQSNPSIMKDLGIVNENRKRLRFFEASGGPVLRIEQGPDADDSIADV